MFELTVTPRFAETDALGHISNTAFPVWFEAARDPVFKIFHPSMSTHDWPLILAKLDIDFTAQTYMHSPVIITTWIGRIGNASCELIHEARQNDNLVARGKAVLVHFNYQTQRSETIAEAIRTELEKHLQGTQPQDTLGKSMQKEES